MLSAAILAVVVVCAAILMHPRVANARLWRATTTPLASIIGSGFLVIGPILDASYGLYAPVAMAALCSAAYLFGSAIRFNIRTIAADDTARSALEQHLEKLSGWSLAFAYFISVAYYLNLFGAFGVSLTPLSDHFHANLLTSAVFALILAIGWLRGFTVLERLEQVSVGIKLMIIAGLLFGLGWYFFGQASTGALILNPPAVNGWGSITLAFGLIVTVQGFETSRYLGAAYNPHTRVRSMRLAQMISTAIYMVYILLLAYVFKQDAFHASETAIIDLMRLVAPILPGLLVLAALSAQFSAAIADTAGSGGLIEERTAGRISARVTYAGLVAGGLALTWSANVFEIISYASRAFAIYYALQAAIAAAGAFRQFGLGWRAALYSALTVLGSAIVVFGVPVE